MHMTAILDMHTRMMNFDLLHVMDLIHGEGELMLIIKQCNNFENHKEGWTLISEELY